MQQNITKRLLASTASLALVAMLATGGSAQSPQAPTVAAGSIAVTRQGQTTVVTQGTDKGIIDWRSFSIGPQEAVRFDQPGRSSVTLNRVTGTDQSRIDGNLSATGQVWLANPNGVMIGPGGQVNVGGLLATTGRIDAQEFLRSGRATIDQIAKDAGILNAGSITTGEGGYAALAAAAIENKGVISARSGTVAAGAGKAMTLDFVGDKLISFQVTQPLDQAPAGAEALITNSGTLSAPSGVVMLSARAAKGVIDRVINMDGYAVASSIAERNGVIVIDGGDNGRIDVTGKLIASGGAAGIGGKIELKGAEISVAPSAVLDVTGTKGGAIVATGGAALTVDGRLDATGEVFGGAISLQANTSARLSPGAINLGGRATADAVNGPGGSIRADAAKVNTQPGSVISARARETGNGGAVALRADSSLSAKGNVTVAGGARGGGGGAVMAASPGDVTVSGRIIADAAAGKGGSVAVAAGGKLSMQGANLTVNGGRSGGVVTLAGSQFVDFSASVVDASGGVVSEIVEFLPDGQFATQMVRINPDGSMYNVPAPPSAGGDVSLRGQQIAIDADTKINAKGTDLGGRINLFADQISLNGVVDASGDKGGQITASARGVVQSGAIVADGVTRDGGVITVQAKNNFISTLGARLQADSVTGRGGQVRVIGTDTGAEDGPATARVFNSGTQTARSVAGRGGAVDVIGQDILLMAATLDASGGTGGGVVRVGGDWQGSGGLAHAKTVLSNGATALKASAIQAGEGGKVVVWSDDRTSFGSKVEARGADGGAGGKVEISSKGVLTYGGMVDAGSLLLDPKNIIIDASVTNVSSVALTDPGSGGTGYGSVISILANGNIVVTSPNDSLGGVTNRGAAYLFNGATGGLISSINGSNTNDLVSNGGVTVLTVSGNFVITSPNWANGAATNAGAVTWGSGATGFIGGGGAVSNANSLVGTTANDSVGSGGITVLTNGNYVVKSPNWTNGAAARAGAATWGSGTSGVKGDVGPGNSLVGSNTDDKVSSGGTVAGVGGVVALTGGGYVVVSPSWANGGALRAGAVTWGDGATGVKGPVSASNSLVGSQLDDQVGSGGITVLSNGNYVVSSPKWANGTATNAGAVTFGSGGGGISGPVGSGNSLIGGNFNDFVGGGPGTVGGTGAVIALSGGAGYVVVSPYWANGGAARAGAVTWGSSTTGVKGPVGPGNSLVGSNTDDRVGSGGITVLANGNYLVSSPKWRNGTATSAGAVTWGSGGSGVSGPVSAANSLVGGSAGDSVGTVTGGGGITALSGGGYVVSSPNWANGIQTRAGAVTWGDGASGVRGLISAANSLVGSMADDFVGSRGVTALANGNYVVVTPSWSNGLAGSAGAVTWGSGASGVAGAITSSNSLVGSHLNDRVGYGGVTALSNGNYVVNSYFWSNGAALQAGAVTWGSGASGAKGVVSSSNSLIGGQAYDQVGSRGVTALTNGNYVVSSPNWTNGAAVAAGGVTWGSGVAGVSGLVSSANSLVGDKMLDFVGSGGVTALTNGNYVVVSPYWGNGAASSVGAVTWGNGGSGLTGIVSSANSLVGSTTGDQIGSGGVVALSNGNYIVISPKWANGGAANAGAVTWGSGAGGPTGAVSSGNSLVGGSANDKVGSGVTSGTVTGIGAVTVVGGGSGYVVNSPEWGSGGLTKLGAVTWGSSATGVTGLVSSANSLVGSQTNDQVGSGGISVLSNGNYIVKSPNWANGGAAQAGAVTWANGAIGIKGQVSASNSLIGAAAYDQVGFGGVTEMANGDYYVANGNVTSGTLSFSKSITFGAGGGGIIGTVNSGNSFIGAALSVKGAAPDSSFLVLREQTGQVYQFKPTGGGVSSSNFGDTPGSDLTISAANLASTLAAGTAVTLQANNDISVNAGVNVTGGGGGALKLQAGRSLNLNGSIKTANGDLTLIANEQVANGVDDANRDPGAAAITMAAGTSLNTGTGNLVIKINDGAGLTNSASGDIQLQAITANKLIVENLGAGASTISLNGATNLAATGDISSTNGGVQITGAITATGDFTLQTNSLAITGGSINSTTGKTIIKAVQASTTIGINGGAGALQLSSAALAQISGKLEVGRSDGSGALDVGSGLTLKQDLTLRTGAGDVTIGAIDAQSVGGQSLTVATGGGSISATGAIGGSTALSSLSSSGSDIISTAPFTIGAKSGNITAVIAGKSGVEATTLVNLTSGSSITVNGVSLPIPPAVTPPIVATTSTLASSTSTATIVSIASLPTSVSAGSVASTSAIVSGQTPASQTQGVQSGTGATGGGARTSPVSGIDNFASVLFQILMPPLRFNDPNDDDPDSSADPVIAARAGERRAAAEKLAEQERRAALLGLDAETTAETIRAIASGGLIPPLRPEVPSTGASLLSTPTFKIDPIDSGGPNGQVIASPSSGAYATGFSTGNPYSGRPAASGAPGGASGGASGAGTPGGGAQPGGPISGEPASGPGSSDAAASSTVGSSTGVDPNLAGEAGKPLVKGVTFQTKRPSSTESGEPPLSETPSEINDEVLMD